MNHSHDKEDSDLKGGAPNGEKRTQKLRDCMPNSSNYRPPPYNGENCQRPPQDSQQRPRHLHPCNGNTNLMKPTLTQWQYFMRHQPFGDLARPYQFPPPRFPQQFQFGTFPGRNSPRSHARRENLASRSNNVPFDNHPHNAREIHKDARPKTSYVNGKKKFYKKKYSNDSSKPSKSKDSLPHAINKTSLKCANDSSYLDSSCENSALMRDDEGLKVSKSCDGSWLNEVTSPALPLAVDSKSPLVEEGAVGGIPVTANNTAHDRNDWCNSDKDLIDEGAIFDLDNIFQNHEHSKKIDASICNNSDSGDDLDLMMGLENNTDKRVFSSSDDSEVGAVGGKISPDGHDSKYNRNRSYVNRSFTHSNAKGFVNNFNGTRDEMNMLGIQRENNERHVSIDSDGGEDTGDFIDTDLPSHSKHILSSSDEMDNMSSAKESDGEDCVSECRAGKKEDKHNSDFNCNDLSTLEPNILNGLHHLRMGGTNCNCGESHQCVLPNQRLSGNATSCVCDGCTSNCDFKNIDLNSLKNSESVFGRLNDSQNNISRPCVSLQTCSHFSLGGAAADAGSCRDIVSHFPDSSEADGEVMSPEEINKHHHCTISNHRVCSCARPCQCGANNLDGNSGLNLAHHGTNEFNSNPLGQNFTVDGNGSLQNVPDQMETTTESTMSSSGSGNQQEIKDEVFDKNIIDVDNVSGYSDDPSSLESNGDHVDMVLLPMEEEIEPVYSMDGHNVLDMREEFGNPSGLQLTSSVSAPAIANVSSSHEDSSQSHARDPVSTGNRLPSKEFYELIKRVSATDSYMQFFDKDGQDVQRSTPRTFNEDDSSSRSKQSSKAAGSKTDCLKVDRVMIWNEYEAYVVQYKQIAVSACGQTAVLNVLKALKFQCEKSVVCKVIKPNLKKDDKDIPEYLFSRSCAGTTAADLMAGVSKLTGGVIGGRFFHFWPARKVKLLQWLAYWMKRGAIPMATLNLQQGPHSIWEVPDSWHHQMVYGVSHQGLYLTNPLEIVSERSAIKQLCSDSVLLVRRQDIVSRFRESTDLGQLLDHPDPRWMSLNVLGQVVNVLRECNMPSVPGYRLQVTSHVRIPASYQAGITLFMRKDKPDWNALVTASEFPLA